MAGSAVGKVRVMGDVPVAGVICVGPVSVVAALVLTAYFPASGAAKYIVKKVRSFVTTALSTTASVVTVKDDEATPATMGTLTIAASAAIADEDSVDTSDSENNIITAGGAITLDIAAGLTSGAAIFFIEYVEAETL